MAIDFVRLQDLSDSSKKEDMAPWLDAGDEIVREAEKIGGIEPEKFREALSAARALPASPSELEITTAWRALKEGSTVLHEQSKGKRGDAVRSVRTAVSKFAAIAKLFAPSGKTLPTPEVRTATPPKLARVQDVKAPPPPPIVVETGPVASRVATAVGVLDRLTAGSPDPAMRAAFARLAASVSVLDEGAVAVTHERAVARGMTEQGLLALGMSDGYGMDLLLSLIVASAVTNVVGVHRDIAPERINNASALKAFAEAMGVSIEVLNTDAIIVDPHKKPIETPDIDAAVERMLARCGTRVVNMYNSIASANPGRIHGATPLPPVLNMAPTGEIYWHKVPVLKERPTKTVLASFAWNVEVWIERMIAKGWVKEIEVGGRKVRPLVVGQFDWQNGKFTASAPQYHAEDRGSILGVCKDHALKAIREAAIRHAALADVVDLVLPYTPTGASGFIPGIPPLGEMLTRRLKLAGTFQPRARIIQTGLNDMLDLGRGSWKVAVDEDERFILQDADDDYERFVKRAAAVLADDSRLVDVSEPHGHYKKEIVRGIPFPVVLKITEGLFPDDWADRWIDSLPDDRFAAQKAEMRKVLAAWQARRSSSALSARPEGAKALPPVESSHPASSAPKAVEPDSKAGQAPEAGVSLPGVPVREVILDQFLDMLAEKTGYEKKELEPDYELEADLGVDTVKQAELFGRVRKEFDIPRDDTVKLAEYKTIDSLVDWILGELAKKGNGGAPVSQPSSSGGGSSPVGAVPAASRAPAANTDAPVAGIAPPGGHGPEDEPSGDFAYLDNVESTGSAEAVEGESGLVAPSATSLVSRGLGSGLYAAPAPAAVHGNIGAFVLRK